MTGANSMSALKLRRMRWARVLAPALAAALLASPAAAQFPDLLSDTECPGCSAGLPDRLPALAGTWSSPLTSSDDPAWALEDFFCVAACTPAARAAATAYLREPANAHRPVLELLAQVQNPKFACDPRGFASQVVSPLPLKIEQQRGRVVLRYEELGAERLVALGEHDAASKHQPHPFGISTGRFENGAFVVETSHIPAGRLYDGFGGGPHSDRLRAIERYTTSDDGRWLFLVLVLDDPTTLGERLVLTKSWRRSPNEILRYNCDVMSGQLEGVLTDYVDPAKLEKRRK
jgi:hypothetical protein